MLRYYFIFKDDRYHLINEMLGLNMKESYSAQQLGSPGTKFVELQFSSNIYCPEIYKVIPMDVDRINGAAIKAVNDHNRKETYDQDEKEEFHARDYKQHAQQVVDRLLMFGDEFERCFNELINKFPIPPTIISEGIKILG